MIGQNIQTNHKSLVSAARNGDLAQMKLLLTNDEIKAKVAANFNEALNTAVKYNKKSIVKLLLEIEEVRKRLVESYIDILSTAIENEHLTINQHIKFTLYKTNVAKRYGKSMSVLHAIIFEGCSRVIDPFLNMGENPEIQYEQMTALHHAIRMNRIENALALIKKANLEAIYRIKTTNGFMEMTPLHHAIRNNATDIALALIAANVNLNATYRGMTALEHAENHPAIKAAILAKQAEVPAVASPILLQAPIHKRKGDEQDNNPKRPRVGQREVSSLLRDSERITGKPSESVDDDNDTQVQTRKRRR